MEPTQIVSHAMNWAEVVALMGGVFVANMGVILPLFLWTRSEANSDRRDILQMIREMKDEMKDFHGRLCAIEERNKEKK